MQTVCQDSCLCACDQTHVCVVSIPLFSVPASELHLISKFILKVCHLSCEPLLGFCSEGGRGVKRGAEAGEKRGETGKGSGGIIREERSDDLGRGCVEFVCGTQQLTSFSLLSSSFPYLFCHHPISVPRLQGLFGGD